MTALHYSRTVAIKAAYVTRKGEPNVERCCLLLILGCYILGCGGLDNDPCTFQKNDYEDITEARERIGHFITQVYHQKRPHSALGYLTPVEFEQKNLS